MFFSARKPAPARSVDPLLPDDPPFLSFHLWLLIAAASVFAFFVAATSGGLAFVIEHDLTFISDAVMVFFLATTVYCGTRAWRLSRELMVVQALAQPAPGESSAKGQTARSQAEFTSRSWVARFLDQVSTSKKPETHEQLINVLTEKLRVSHEIGWFITETMTKLGLLGTVIGFLVMLTALVGSNQLELTAMQSILRDMASGMGIKIIATVVGLLCNIILALQWLLLDRCADKVLAGAIYLSSIESSGDSGPARSAATVAVAHPA
jgi:biopolymer transport protein ExbB/TolQ